MPLDFYNSLTTAYEERTERIRDILASYKLLYTTYDAALKLVTPKGSGPQMAFEKAKTSAEEKQKEISEALHPQAVVLIAGVSEALLKDLFDSLLIENFIDLRSGKGVSFSTSEVQKILIESDERSSSFNQVAVTFGRYAVPKLRDNAKINFQNLKDVRDAFRSYFEINIPRTTETDLVERYWQVRHCIVHNNSVIDEDFLEKLNPMGQLKDKEKFGVELKIKKKDYEEAYKSFHRLFDLIDALIREAGLQSRFVRLSMPKS